MLEYKQSIKDISTQNGTFYGYASVFNVKDSYNDIILNGAFKNSLKHNNIKNINLLWQHDKQKIIGNFNIIKEDSVGLYVEGKINNTNDNIYSYVKSGFIKGLSIGYRVNDFYFDNKGNRILKDVDLIEISIVNCPANKHSNITYCKSKYYNSHYNTLSCKIDRLINNFNLDITL